MELKIAVSGDICDEQYASKQKRSSRRDEKDSTRGDGSLHAEMRGCGLILQVGSGGLGGTSSQSGAGLSLRVSRKQRRGLVNRVALGRGASGRVGHDD